MIKPLSEDLRNKIAAGEVVENPSSVVKELIENSLDANSSKIYIVVEKGGQALIQLRDNGKGIPEEQLPSAILRFHTSKISTLEIYGIIFNLSANISSCNFLPFLASQVISYSYIGPRRRENKIPNS